MTLRYAPARPTSARLNAPLALALAAGMLATPAATAQNAPATDAPTAGADAPTAGADATTPLSPDTVVATVDGRPITEGDLDLALVPLQPGQPPLSPEQRRARALSDVIGVRAVAAKAVEAGMDDAELERRVAFLRDRELHNAYLRETIEPSITESLLRERYEREIGQSPPVEEVRARHILLETAEEAEAVIGELEGGADFAELARARSTGPSAATGGDLGYFGPGRMVPAFDAAARELEAGEFTTEPVQTQFGYHVILVEDVRAVEPPTFEQIRDQVQELVTRERYVETLREARAAVDVEIADEALARLIGPAAGVPASDTAPATPSSDAPAPAAQ